jgi:hypothetical protein
MSTQILVALTLKNEHFQQSVIVVTITANQDEYKLGSKKHAMAVLEKQQRRFSILAAVSLGTGNLIFSSEPRCVKHS